MQSIIEHSYTLGEALIVSLIIELLKNMYSRTRTRESDSPNMSDVH
ncbi:MULTISPECIES: hypothetical protein [Exiguobacterium]|nr:MULTISPECIES: hypothetical protein [Exiguobacterium]